MTGERMIPMLPCADIDAIADFAVALGSLSDVAELRAAAGDLDADRSHP